MLFNNVCSSQYACTKQRNFDRSVALCCRLRQLLDDLSLEVFSANNVLNNETLIIGLII